MRRIALLTAVIESSWLMIRLWSSSSMRSSFSVSSSVSLKTGMPVQVASTSAISSSSTSESTSISPDFHSRSRRWRSSTSWRSSSRSEAAFSKSCASIALSLRRRTSAIFSSTSRTSGGAVILRIRIRDPASSIRSIALSGRNRSLM